MLNKITRIFLALFATSCVFDPADKIFGLKMPLFGAIFLLAVVQIIRKRQLKVDFSIVSVVAIFLFFPLIGILNGIVVQGQDGQLGFSMYKGYVLTLLLPILYIFNINLIPTLARVLTALAVVIIITYVLILNIPEAYVIIHTVGNASGLITPDKRSYGGGDEYLQIYYVTSPMLVLAIAYYFSLASEKSMLNRLKPYSAVFICVLGLVLAGSRNNIFIAFILPATLLFLNSRNKLFFMPFIGSALIILVSELWVLIMELLNPMEFSNSLKLNLVKDYLAILQDPVTLLFGQGLGVDIYWSARGYNDHLSELTYFEMVRNFGVIGASILMGALLTPLYRLASGSSVSVMYRNIVVAYMCYLLMCFTNPLLFSSLGILIFVSVFACYVLEAKSKPPGQSFKVR